jgi:hypothetical protein
MVVYKKVPIAFCTEGEEGGQWARRKSRPSPRKIVDLTQADIDLRTVPRTRRQVLGKPHVSALGASPKNKSLHLVSLYIRVKDDHVNT